MTMLSLYRLSFSTMRTAAIGLLALLALLLTPAAPAQAQSTVLAAGDIAIIGFNMDNPDQFSFVLMTNVAAGTTINFTDRGWLAAGGFRGGGGEGTDTWVASSNLCAGTVITLTANNMVLDNGGDQIIAYQGTDASPTLIYALNDEGAAVWQANATNANNSALPTGLVNGTTAVALNEIDNAIYTGTTTGTRAALLAAIGTPGNWSGSDATRQTMPTGPFTITDAGPCPPAGTTLTAGDIAIIGFNMDDPDQFSFVLLTHVSPWTTINFTDRGWLAAGGFRNDPPDESTDYWTAPTGLCAGTVITLTANNMVLDNGGDQIIAYQGTDASPTLIYALNDEGAAVWQANATNANNSALPTGLVNGTTAVALNEIDNAIYTGTTTGTRAALLAAIGTPGNWSGSNATRQTMPTGPFTVTDAPPCPYADTAPTVTSTDPADGATGVAVNSNVTINFSEDVTVSGAWFTLSCTSSGAVTATVSGGPSSYVLNPDTDFANNETCTVTVVAAQVSDTDTNDPPDTMAADYTFSFTTADTAPTVTSTDPADGATGVAVNSNVTINFSEDVTVSGAWFTLSCTSSGAVTATVSGGPSSYVLNPDTDFANSETCTVTVVAAQVSDTDTNDPPDTMAADYTFSFTTAAAVTPPTPTPPPAVVPVGGLTLTASVAPSVVISGDTAIWTFTVSNGTPTGTGPLTLTVPIPASLSVTGVTTTQGVVTSASAPTVTVDLGSLGAGGQAVVTISAQINVVTAAIFRPVGVLARPALQAAGDLICLTGTTADLSATACVTLFPEELPETGGGPVQGARLIWIAVLVAVAAIGGVAMHLWQRRRTA